LKLLGEFELAIYDLDTVIDSSEKHRFIALLERGKCFHSQGDTKSALLDFNEVEERIEAK
jgi:hypothetical protein